MNKSQRTSLTFGIILVVLGAIFIAANLIPSFRVILNQANTWPMIIELVAAGLLVLGLMLGVPDMAVPATIVAGIGGILWWQNSTGNWASWAYMWALIPGFVGVGMLLAKVWVARPLQHHFCPQHNRLQPGDVRHLWRFLGGFSWMGPLLAVDAHRGRRSIGLTHW